jgi:hypothetical protein
MTQHTGASAASTRSTAPAGGSHAVGQVGSSTSQGDGHSQEHAGEGTGTIKAGHGNTPAAWSAVGLMLVGFVVWAIGMVTGPNWVLVWIGVAIVPISVALGWAMGRAGLGSTRY